MPSIPDSADPLREGTNPFKRLFGKRDEAAAAAPTAAAGESAGVTSDDDDKAQQEYPSCFPGCGCQEEKV